MDSSNRVMYVRISSIVLVRRNADWSKASLVVAWWREEYNAAMAVSKEDELEVDIVVVMVLSLDAYMCM